MNLGHVSFSQPWMGLIALAPMILWLWRHFRNRKPGAIIFSDLRLIKSRRTIRLSTLWLPNALGCLAWFALSVSLMGPRLGHEATKITTEGVAISMVLDVSGSMKENDMVVKNRQLTRYEMVQQLFRKFVQGDESLGLQGRSNDMISLVLFGGWVDDVSPLTHDHAFLLDLMDDSIAGIRKDQANYEKLHQKGDRRSLQRIQNSQPIWQKTAIYEGVALGSDLLKKAEDGIDDAEQTERSSFNIQSKVLIVLSDGEDNASSISSDEAIEVAKEFGVKIYSIAVHGDQVKRDLGGLFSLGSRKMDDSDLKKMAEETGGRFYKANNPETLGRILTDIDSLERTRFSREVTMDYAPWHEPWLIVALLLWGCSILLSNTIYRILP